jgi:hypothetical protein
MYAKHLRKKKYMYAKQEQFALDQRLQHAYGFKILGLFFEKRDHSRLSED